MSSDNHTADRSVAARDLHDRTRPTTNRSSWRFCTEQAAPADERTIMFKGLSTVSLYAKDHEAAKNWYTTLFGGVPPYFDMPGYFEFRIGDQQDELGVIDASYAPPGALDGPAGA